MSKTILHLQARFVLAAMAFVFAISTDISAVKIGQAYDLVAYSADRSKTPLQITAVSVSPEPVVGRIVNLQVEVGSSEDAPETTIS